MSETNKITFLFARLRSGIWLTPLIDLMTFVIYGTLFAAFSQRLNEARGWNGAVIIAVYLLMCFFLFLSRGLEPGPIRDVPRTVPPPGIADAGPSSSQKGGTTRDDKKFGAVFFLSWGYSVFVVVMAAETSGLFRSDTALGARLENLGSEGGVILLPLALVFFGLLILFPLVLLRNPEKKWLYGTARHTAVRSLSTLSVNAMMLINTVFWEWQLADTEPLDIAIGGKLLVFAASYVVFLMFYAPPRLALLSSEPSRWSFAGYALFLGYTVWTLMG